ncbi:uncharacterized protein N7506_006810 [Penicillium brevicompactum]|uniref:uncharacterized protein n=1 Tax=Penicillium brevicompactum TaxID=5074 RepID=UPI0025400832|nr:uncharacterized protein N7506_006810 [Penicillium brevicompactum]KAJ5333027.1 hypothetical protein N7506_006810 [Penicillium brevicompactum]
MADSTQQQPLVKGGHKQSPSDLPATFTSSTMPIVHENTIILAATHPSIRSAHPAQDGWFISDFYAFNYLLKGQGQKQTWLTAADPRRLIQEYGPYLHGNPCEERKTCLDNDMLDQDELTPVTVVRSNQMIDRFLSEARLASELAKRTEAPLLLLVFCHGHSNYHPCLNDDNQSKGLSILALKAVLDPGARITLVTTACYSGGWATTPDLNITSMAAASERHLDPQEDYRRALSNAWGPSLSVGRTCGSIFASTLFQTLSSATSPLLDARESSNASDPLSLQPEEPNDQQTLTYNSFCQSVLDTCQNSVTRLGDMQYFTFSARDDKWDFSWTGRTGIPLAHFERRWQQMKSYPYTGTEEMRRFGSQSPGNATFEVSDSNKVGGVREATDGEIIENMTALIAQHKIKEMAMMFHATCPGDWSWGREVAWGGTLFRLYRFGEFLADEAEIYSTIRFRWEMALLADHFVATYELPMPRNEMCILWDWYSWMHEFRAKNSMSESEFDQRWQEGQLFMRPFEYLVAAFLESNRPEHEISVLSNSIREFLQNAEAFHRQRIFGSPEVRRTGREWLRSVGRRARKSLSPQKRERSSTTESASC